MNQPKIRPATAEDQARLLELLPLLADFDIPKARKSEDLWLGDVPLLKAVLAGNASQSFLDVAVNEEDFILGLVLITLREELLSHAPSAHLEAIVVAPEARGMGLGRTLLQHTEDAVRERGAHSLSLHVFNKNKRAKSLYTSHGFDNELIRAIKWLDQ
ncbi:GNAT family N-acetyltransferase [Pseudomonadales bacterium]|jgi:ribosomal protein S18 acetylase RimI-like enzyme|nr:GNAT family N-acetyltransferase [Pseudomonadales bacterium]MDB2595679.1 GNAT family N-acetyltransferase [Pseudomonadales bacterium]MDB9756747.1 GNAT family N-acetyltransferase [Pseudomonadales bacterium]